MENELNALEKSIISEIADINEKQCSFLKNHLPHLKVKSREYTGVGMYVNFVYDSNHNPNMFNDECDLILSSDTSLELDVLKHGLNYELTVTKGRIIFLELVTNGESWNGAFQKFKFLK
ncbi:hypothetical protein SYJ56_05025 [Algoriphagus sp. D3-2-R+10]|uniref:hypothetical protein n=1 Tax=Algoriphagus aurantiacus TaxID=3103948 RepID=UPI002B3FFC38|nr:hypothetical protein [Algoriphagus sp. D3-2-R+10]MEB2774656.1 hypothetical protein [Algoriphagus sp. D3-2-R+10]